MQDEQEGEPSASPCDSGWSQRSCGPDELSSVESGCGTSRPARRCPREEYATAFMHPEWMLEPPADLATAWWGGNAAGEAEPQRRLLN